jgi:beta-D-xylosidase 4
VLLKNLDGLLPMKRGLRIALIGVSSDSGEDLLGNYVGPICPSGKFECVPSLYDKLKELNAPGDVTVVSDPSKVNDAIQAAQLADFVVLVASNAHDGGGEGQDRTTISLAANQMTLLQAVLKVKISSLSFSCSSSHPHALPPLVFHSFHPTPPLVFHFFLPPPSSWSLSHHQVGKPSALVLINGGIIAIDELADSAPAIIEAFMPGIFGAQVIAETLFGINNPGGKMPVTMYQSNYINQVDFLNMSMTNGVGRSYRYFTGTKTEVKSLYQLSSGVQSFIPQC